MPPRADSSSRSSGASAQGASAPAAAAAAASGGPSTSVSQPPEPPEFAAAKLQWALAVPPEQRQPSVQAFIDSCECTTEATRLLAAAPLALLPGPAKLRALLLLLKAHLRSFGQSPAVPGLHLLPIPPDRHVPEQARCNHIKLLTQEPSGHHPELQPLYTVAATAAHVVLLSGMATAHTQAASLANSSAAPIAQSISSRRLSELVEGHTPVSPDEAAGLLRTALDDIRQLRAPLQHQLAAMGGGLLTVQQLEHSLLFQLAVVHTWAATPDGAYCGGRIDRQHAAAGRAAFSAALELSHDDFCTSGLLVALSNLLRRTGAVAEAEAALRRAVAAARACGDAMQELNAAATLASAIAAQDSWSYQEMEGLVAAMQRCLKDCKPWSPNPIQSHYRERAREAQRDLDDARRAWPTSYASRQLPAKAAVMYPNSFVPDRAAKKFGACSGCGGHYAELKACSRCRTAKYCSRACQADHWRAGHKAECVPVGERAESSSRSS